MYEVYENNLLIPILRATGMISNPLNPARTTPAGPPIPTNDSQSLGENQAELYVFFGNQKAFDDTIKQVIIEMTNLYKQRRIYEHTFRT